jgi:hypothetical protein
MSLAHQHYSTTALTHFVLPPGTTGSGPPMVAMACRPAAAPAPPAATMDQSSPLATLQNHMPFPISNWGSCTPPPWPPASPPHSQPPPTLAWLTAIAPTPLWSSRHMLVTRWLHFNPLLVTAYPALPHGSHMPCQQFPTDALVLRHVRNDPRLLPCPPHFRAGGRGGGGGPELHPCLAPLAIPSVHSCIIDYATYMSSDVAIGSAVAENVGPLRAPPLIPRGGAGGGWITKGLGHHMDMVCLSPFAQ